MASQAELLATVVIPARNEAPFLEAALDAVAEQDVALDRIEVIVVDGGSTDGTAEIARRWLSDHVLASSDVIVNEEGSTPSNLNAGLLAAKGDVLIRVDARSRIPSTYVRRCVELLSEEPQRFVVVGGRQRARPNGSSLEARGIARALNNRFGMGLARYRRAGAVSGPTDTVYLGAFRRQDLVDVGGWDLNMASNQDFALNRRLAEATGLDVWFTNDLVVNYLGRPTLRELAAQYHRFGRWKAIYWHRAKARPQPRQLVLLAAPPLFGVAGLWLWSLFGVKGRTAMLTSGLLGAVIVDQAGSESPRSAAPADGGSRVRESIVSSVALAIVGIGWWSGVAYQWVSARIR